MAFNLYVASGLPGSLGSLNRDFSRPKTHAKCLLDISGYSKSCSAEMSEECLINHSNSVVQIQASHSNGGPEVTGGSYSRTQSNLCCTWFFLHTMMWDIVHSFRAIFCVRSSFNKTSLLFVFGFEYIFFEDVVILAESLYCVLAAFLNRAVVCRQWRMIWLPR